jgi:hypothetical protein
MYMYYVLCIMYINININMYTWITNCGRKKQKRLESGKWKRKTGTVITSTESLRFNLTV